MSRCRYIFNGLLALVLVSCRDTTTEPESQQPAAISTASPILLTYMCDNTFRVRNSTDSSVVVTWDVYKTSETGTLTLPSRAAGAPYSETFFDTRNKGTVRVFRSGVLVQTKANGGFACKRHLRVGLSDGVTGAPISPDSTYSPGAVVSYNFTPTPGRDNVLVLLDSAFVPATGTITMDRDHALFASSDSIVELRPEDQPLLESARGLLTASDPVAAFQAHLQRLASFFDEVGPDEAQQRLDVVSYLAFDPSRDDAALRRLDSALAGRVFKLGIHSSVSTSAPALKRASLLAVDGSVPSAEDSVSFFYVNGILTSREKAFPATAALRSVLQTAIADLSTDSVALFYNRNFQAQGGGPAVRLVRCLQGGADAIKYVGVLAAVRLSLDCDQQTLVNFLRTFDLVELQRQWLSVSGTTSQSLETDAIGLANALQAERNAGRHVIVTAHSQGNLMLQQAVGQLRNSGMDSANSSPCIGAMSLAAPTSENWPVDPDKLDGVVAEGDIILSAPSIFPGLAPNNFPRYETELYLKAQRDGAAATLVSPALGGIVGFFYAIALHDAVKSYFGSPMIRTVILNGLLNDYRSCVPAFVSITPSLLRLTVDQTGQLSATVMNRNGSPLANRRITWTSSNPTVASVDSTGAVKALALGSATITARSGAVTGIGVVQVIDPSPFPPNVTVFGTWFRTVQNEAGTCDHTLSINVGATSTLDCHNGFPIISRYSNSEEPPFIRVTLFGLAANPDERYRLALAGDGNTLTGTFGLAGDPGQPVTFARVQP